MRTGGDACRELRMREVIWENFICGRWGYSIGLLGLGSVVDGESLIEADEDGLSRMSGRVGIVC